MNEVGSDGKWGVVLLDTRPYSGLAHGTQGGSVRVLYTQTFAGPYLCGFNGETSLLHR